MEGAIRRKRGRRETTMASTAKRGGGRGEWGVASLEDASDNDEIYGAIASVQGTTNTNTKDNTKDDNDEEGRMVGIPQFWICTIGHMEAVAKLIMERDIDCL